MSNIKLKRGEVYQDNKGKLWLIKGKEDRDGDFYAAPLSGGVERGTYFNKDTGREYAGRRRIVSPGESPSYLLSLKSLSYIAELRRGRLRCGCQHLSKKDTLELFRWLGDQLGYDVEA